MLVPSVGKLPCLFKLQWPEEKREGLLRYVGAAVGFSAAAYTFWTLHRNRNARWPPGGCSPGKRDVQKPRMYAPLRRPGYQHFPPPYPNGWVYVCASELLSKGAARPLYVCGKHLVLFRTQQGRATVLDAYCPHMGTHLGYGGFVRGGCIVCPYHEWRFNADGKLEAMPFGGRATSAKGASACNTRAYHVLERHGMIFAWLHADEAEPLWQPEILDLSDDLRPICRVVTDDFMMHCMEPSHNSADWYHFQTVHSALGQHWLSRWKWLKIKHELKPCRMAMTGSVDDDGSRIEDPHLLIIDEKVREIHALNGTIPLPAWVASASSSQVRFNGPLMNCFIIKFPILGELVVYMLITPTAPFVTHVEYVCFANRRWPRLLAYVMTQLICRTVEQDREVWEHRMHGVRNVVKGDFDYEQYEKWFYQFFSPSSIAWDHAYEDLTW